MFGLSDTQGQVFHLETVRVIGNDWVVRHDNRYFQVKAQARQYTAGQGQFTSCFLAIFSSDA